ncbi:alkaline phosphatase family protein [Alkalihalobacillus sp. AL-G]|uniref:alkaline phosphatase family protein n=1 Tax=Alkalihalobacillus sp. AL-G TaxID=2926399 RepID=UPI00351AB7FB
MQYVLAIAILITILTVIFFIKARKPVTQSLETKLFKRPSKQVVLLIIDSLMDEPLQKAIKEGRVPAFEFFMKHGSYYPNVVSSYPTMSVTIDSTLLTGTYSDKHQVPALVWYDEKTKRFVSYGSAWKEVLKLGVKNVAKDTLYHLNHTHLSRKVKTIHEELAMTGSQSSSINVLVYRGEDKTMLHLPKLLSKLNIVPEKLHIETSLLFSYGRLAQYSPKNNQNNQLWKGVGFNDKFSAQELVFLIENGKLPAFTIAYFPDLDKNVHKKGPVNHLGAIEKVDKQLQEILNAYESWDEALNDVVWIVMGDSGQATVGNDKNKSFIDLRSILESYRIHKITEPIQEDDQIVLGLNERMTFIYSLDEDLSLEDIVKHLKRDDRIGVIAWKNGTAAKVLAGGNKGLLTFEPNGTYKDRYDQSWSLVGELDVLDLTVENEQIDYGKYPDVLARLYSSLSSHPGRYIVVDAKPGYEFVGEGSPTHLGGASHGSIHKDDSLIPMIVTGTDLKPKHLRIVDMKSWILQILKN